MSIIAWILLGIIIGAIARLLMPGRDPGGFWATILLGIVGSLVGGFIGHAVGLYSPGLKAAGWILSVAVSVLFLAVYGAIVRRRAT